MSRESECHYGGQDDVEYMMRHNNYDASNFEDMGDYYDDYTDNDPHDMMDHHQDFRYNYSDYDSDYSSVHDKERYHDVKQLYSLDIVSLGSPSLYIYTCVCELTCLGRANATMEAKIMMITR